MAGGAIRIETPTAIWALAGEGASETRPTKPASSRVRRDKRLRIRGPPQRSLAPYDPQILGRQRTEFSCCRRVIRCSRLWLLNPSLRPSVAVGGENSGLK